MIESISSPRPLTERDPRTRVFIRLVSQVSLRIAGEGTFREMQKRVLKWGMPRIGPGIPDSAWEGKTFEVDSVGAQKTAAVALDEPNYWAFRLDDADKEIAGRVWTTEVGLAEANDGQAVFGCRLLCSERGQSGQILRSVPNFVRGIVFTQEAYLDDRRQIPEPWFVHSREDVEELFQLLISENRKHPIVVFSLPEGSTNASETIIPAQGYLRRTVGYVHTVVLSGDATFQLTDRLGPDFAVYHQAVRTYWPGLQPDVDLTSDHPVAVAENVRSWQLNHEESFEDFLVNQTLRVRRPREELEREHPPFHVVKRRAAELTRDQAQKSGGSYQELLASADEEIQAAKRESEDAWGLLAVAEEESEAAQAEAREAKANLFALQARIEHLQGLVENGGGADVEIPDQLDVIDEWSQKNLSGSLVLLPRAVRAAKKSDFADVKLVYTSLLTMRDFYVPMRREGGQPLVERWETEVAKLGLENTKCFAEKNKAKAFGDTYFVGFQGQKRELDWHLKGSNSRDGRLGFRLYYFWDAETRRVVVGYLPGHLRNDQT